MNRVGGVVVAVLMAVAVVAGVGIAATAHAAQSSPALVLPPVPAFAASPSVTVDQPRNAGASPAKTTVVVPAASATTTAPVALTAPAPAAAQSVAVQVKATPALPVAAPQPQASPVVQKAEPAPPPVATASVVVPPVTSLQVTTAASKGAPVNAAAQSKPVSAEHADAVPIWSPDLPPHVAAQPAGAVAPEAAPHLTYAAIPQNPPTAMKPASAPIAAPAAVAQPAAPPAPAQAVAAPAGAETPAALPAAPQPAAAPTALAAILPPSAAHTDYPRLNGITTGERMLEEDDYGTTREPANWIVRIFKHNHRLEVYYRDNLYKSYHAVFGRSLWPGAKEIENDRRTPEGDYMIVQKHPSARFDWFLKINYPNAEDRAHFEELRDEGKIPAWEREGGQVGIHGTDNPILNVGDVNWTTGCISIDNGDIAELARLLPIGTVVIIRP